MKMWKTVIVIWSDFDATGLRFNGQGEHADDVQSAVDLIAEAMEQEEEEDEDQDDDDHDAREEYD